MAENLFQGLPPPATSPSRSSVQHRQEQSLKLNVNKGNNNNARDSPPIPNPALKSALKRPKPPALNQEGLSCFVLFLILSFCLGLYFCRDVVKHEYTIHDLPKVLL